MSDINFVAQNVARDWAALAGSLPKDLSEAIAVYNEAGYAQEPYTGLDVDKLTTKNAQQAVTDLAVTLAAAALPGQITSGTLVDAGPAVLDAYQRGTAAAGVIGAVDTWLARLADLPAHAGFDRDPVLRVLAPSTPHQLHMLVNATGGNKDQHLARLGVLYVEAVRAGISFEMHTPREAAQLRSELEEAARAERAKKAFA